MLDDVESTTMTVRPYSTMLPPIWVAACADQRRRNAGVAEDGTPRSARTGSRTSSAPAGQLRLGHDPVPGGGFDGGGQRGITAAHESGQSPFDGRARARSTCRPQPWQRRPRSAPSRSTSQVSPPHGCAPGQANDVAEQERGACVGSGIGPVRVSKARSTMGRDELARRSRAAPGGPSASRSRRPRVASRPAGR